MCLIAYVPSGKALARTTFDHANLINSDGIGIMSELGVEKFFGSKALKRARNYAAELAKQEIAHAVHWRFATHGSKGLALCHPFKLPNVEAYLMHNGVIGSTAQEASEDASDTLLYVNKLTDAPADHKDLNYWNKVCGDIGKYNKGVVMYPDGQYIILNQDEGIEVDGIWYSNQYSLPQAMRKSTSYFKPQRLRDKWQGYPGHDSRGTYYETGRPTRDWGGPFGSMIYWSQQQNAYGFWTGNNFTKLFVGIASVQDPLPGTPIHTELKPDPKPEPEQKALVPVSSMDDANRCPRCNRLKALTIHHLACYCEPLELALFYKAKGIKPPLSSGPSLGEDRYDDDGGMTLSASGNVMCEHGELDWENCRECVNRLISDETGDDCRLPGDNGGHPSDKADELASKIIWLPPKVSSK